MKTKFRGLIKAEKKVCRVLMVDWIFKDITVCPLEILVTEPKDIPSGAVKNYSFKEVKLLTYINIKDKNGREVYYQDLIKKDNTTYTVEFDKAEGTFYLKSTLNTIDDISVIGVAKGETLGNVEENLHILIPNK